MSLLCPFSLTTFVSMDHLQDQSTALIRSLRSESPKTTYHSGPRLGGKPVCVNTSILEPGKIGAGCVKWIFPGSSSPRPSRVHLFPPPVFLFSPIGPYLRLTPSPILKYTLHSCYSINEAALGQRRCWATPSPNHKRGIGCNVRMT